MAKLPLNPGKVLGVVREVRKAEAAGPLLVAGAPGTAQAIRDALVAGGDSEAVRDLSGSTPSPYDFEGAEVVVYAIEGERAAEDDEKVLRLAGRKGVEIVCVVVGTPPGVTPTIPYVLDTDILAVPEGAPLPVGEIAARVSARAEESAHGLAARLPALRPAVVDRIVKSVSQQNGFLGVAIFIPGADFPVLTVNQIRMVLQIAAAHGEPIDFERAVEIVPLIAAAFGFRAAARQLVGIVPGFGWAVKGGMAYAGTRALGEAAAVYFAAGGTERLRRSVRSWS